MHSEPLICLVQPQGHLGSRCGLYPPVWQHRQQCDEILPIALMQCSEKTRSAIHVYPSDPKSTVQCNQKPHGAVHIHLFEPPENEVTQSHSPFHLAFSALNVSRAWEDLSHFVCLNVFASIDQFNCIRNGFRNGELLYTNMQKVYFARIFELTLLQSLCNSSSVAGIAWPLCSIWLKHAVFKKDHPIQHRTLVLVI